MADDLADDKLTPAQYRAISGLLTEPSIRKAAEASGVKERTLYSWLKQPDFTTVYREARREATQQAIAQLQRASGAAAATLMDLASHSTPVVRLGAARAILEFAIKAVELDDLEARLAELERKYAERN